VFRYFWLGGDSAMPSGLHTGLCHAFLVFFCFIFHVFTFLVLPILVNKDMSKISSYILYIYSTINPLYCITTIFIFFS